MSENVIHIARKGVYLEGKRAFGDGRIRGYNPYIKTNQEYALIWWNGWDAAQVERKKTANMFEGITQVQRERAYIEGELAFNEGTPRASNPYNTDSSTLEQVWINGWDHSRRINKSKIQPFGRNVG